MELDIMLHKENVDFAEVQAMVTYLLSHGFSVTNMNIRAE